MKSESLILYTNDLTGMTVFIYKDKIMSSNSNNEEFMRRVHSTIRAEFDESSVGAQQVRDILEGIKLIVSTEGVHIK